VGRPGFKPGGWRQALPGGFDSRAPPPVSSDRGKASKKVATESSVEVFACFWVIVDKGTHGARVLSGE
jgi:hypothetical protein